MKKGQILENILVESVAAEGKCVSRINDMVVFIPWVVPGDIVDIQITRKKHSFCEAKVVKLVKDSPLRITPRCQHFGVCGGCRWQNMPYEEQTKAKEQQVKDQLRRIGKITEGEWLPILGSVKTFEYRNKLEFGFSIMRVLLEVDFVSVTQLTDYDRNAVGFHISGAFDKILPIENCHLMDPLQNRIRNAIRDYAHEESLVFYDLRENRGLLRDMVLRNSETGEWMLIFQFRIEQEGDEHKALKLLEFVADKFPELTSIMWVNNTKCNDTFGDLEVKVFKGNDHIIEVMEDLKFKVGPKSFYQTNTLQAYKLYCVVREFAQLTGNELVYDLYTGTGTIANFVARQARQVIGIEYVEEAILDARVNSAVNGISITLIYAEDMKDILTDDFLMAHGRPDVIITDPPRAGMHQDVVNVILNAQPKRVVYVSCNPATQARDLQLMSADYQVLKIQPVDMFPHTPHVENVVLLERR